MDKLVRLHRALRKLHTEMMSPEVPLGPLFNAFSELQSVIKVFFPKPSPVYALDDDVVLPE